MSSYDIAPASLGEHAGVEIRVNRIRLRMTWPAAKFIEQMVGRAAVLMLRRPGVKDEGHRYALLVNDEPCTVIIDKPPPYTSATRKEHRVAFRRSAEEGAEDIATLPLDDLRAALQAALATMPEEEAATESAENNASAASSKS